MPIDLIDKIQPKNNAFVGLVDAAQVIGLSAYMSSGSSINISGTPNFYAMYNTSGNGLTTGNIRDNGTSISFGPDVKINDFGFSIGSIEASSGVPVYFSSDSDWGIYTAYIATNPVASVSWSIQSDIAGLSFGSFGSQQNFDAVPNISYASSNVFLSFGKLLIYQGANDPTIFINGSYNHDVSIYSNEIYGDHEVSANSTLYLNKHGFLDGNSFYRNLEIGNGKGTSMATFDAIDNSFGFGPDVKINNYGFSVGPYETTDGQQIFLQTSSTNGTIIYTVNTNPVGFAGLAIATDVAALDFASWGSSFQGDVVSNIPFAGINWWFSYGNLVIQQGNDNANLFVNQFDMSDINIFRNEVNADYQVDNDATLYLNRRGFQNGNTHFRSTQIGDGKLGTIATFDATNHNISATGNIKATAFTTDGINNWNLGAYTAGTSVPTGKITVQINGASYEIQVKAL